MRKDFMWERGREVRERDGGVRKRLIKLITSKEKEVLSEFERSKICINCHGRKRELVTVNVQEGHLL